MPHIILDTDLGSDVDDALCLALALAAPEVELEGVTHVGRKAARRAKISARLLELAGRAEVPVYAGRSEPLDDSDRFVWFGHEGVGILEGAPIPAISPEDGVDVLRRAFRSPSDLELVTVGPLTNVAAALDLDPQLAGRIRQLTVMGGHLRAARFGGITMPWGYDYNLCADPVAAIRVLTAGIPTRLVPLDVTMQVWLTERDRRALQASPSPLNNALGRAVARWGPGLKDSLVHAGADPAIDVVAFLHDPLALACTYDESFCTFEDLWIEPRIEDGLLRTRERPAAAPGAHRLRCATAVDDAERFVAHVRERLGLSLL